MKVIDDRFLETSFDNLTVGDTFLYKDIVFLATLLDGEITGVGLSSDLNFKAGIVYRFSNDIGLIVKVNCNITLK